MNVNEIYHLITTIDIKQTNYSLQEGEDDAKDLKRLSVLNTKQLLLSDLSGNDLSAYVEQAVEEFDVEEIDGDYYIGRLRIAHGKWFEINDIILGDCDSFVYPLCDKHFYKGVKRFDNVEPITLSGYECRIR
jgi:hypothetical protein